MFSEKETKSQLPLTCSCCYASLLIHYLFLFINASLRLKSWAIIHHVLICLNMYQQKVNVQAASKKSLRMLGIMKCYISMLELKASTQPATERAKFDSFAKTLQSIRCQKLSRKTYLTLFHKFV